MSDIWVGDIEGDSLDPTVIYCLVATKNGKDFVELTDYSEMISFLEDIEFIVIHNGIQFDSYAIEKLLGIDIEDKVIDSLPLSWYLNPERFQHGLEEWGEEFGIEKPYVEDWKNITQEAVLHRCREDVKIQWKLWQQQKRHLSEIYNGFENSWPLIRYLNFKMYCAKLQAESKWKFDLEYANEAVEVLSKLKEERKSELEAVMPKVPVKVKRNPPKRPYKSDGSLSTTGQNWKSLTEINNLPFEYDQPIDVITGYDEPNANSNVQVKDWLYSLGWVPETFKIERDKKTNEIKEKPQISKPKTEGGGLCPSVLKLTEKEPNLVLLDGYYVIGHRLSLIQGMINQVNEEGYISAGIAGLTNTLRMKHKGVVNLPKVGVEYGEYARGSLIADEENELCGSDMSSLEDRLKQHFMYDYDPEYVEEMNVSDFDPHIDLAVMAGMIDREQGLLYKENKNKEENLSSNLKAEISHIALIRGIAKNGNYA